MKKYSVLCMMVGFCVAISACDLIRARDVWDIGKDGVFVYAQTEKGRALTFQAAEAENDAYRVLDLKRVAAEEENLFGGVAFLWGIPLAEVPEDRPFTAHDIQKGEHMVIVPATNDVRAALVEKLTLTKGCWAKITLVGDRIQLIEEDHLPAQNSRQFFYLTDFSTTW